MKFDIKHFYSTISEKLLEKALDFANKYKKVTKHEKTIIYSAAKSILVNQGDIWTNKVEMRIVNSLTLLWVANTKLKSANY